MARRKIGAEVESRPFRSIITNGVTAHRGNSAEYPENTLIAFESALSLGVDWIELDVLRTKDGNLVAIHDETTKRVGDLELKVDDVNYDELKNVDVAFYFRKERKLPIEICPKMTVPLLSEVINLVKTQHKTRISIHPKASIVEEIFSMIKKLDAVKWVGFNGTELEYMIRAKSLDKSIPIFFDRFQTDLSKDISLATRYGFESIIIHNSQVSKNNIESIHAAGLISGCWTVDTPIFMDTYLTMGIDIIYTNDPKKLLAIKYK